MAEIACDGRNQAHLKEPQSLKRDLSILNDVAYIMECIAMDYTGEAKYEISNLNDRLQSIRHQTDKAVWSEIQNKLQQAENALGNSEASMAAGFLSGVSRRLWNRVMPELES